jgi:AraC-like DNA-binding protein
MNKEAIYVFEPAVNRKVITANHIFYTIPEKHPDRILNEHDIFYVIDGQETVFLEDQEYYLNTGDVMLLPAKYHHYGRQLYKPDTHAMYIHFSTERRDYKAGENDVIPANSLMLPVSMHINSREVFDYFQKIVKIYLSNLPHKDLRCSALLNLLLFELSEGYRQKDYKHNEIIDEVLALIANHPQKFYSITELSKFSGLCPKSLTSYFMAVTGQSVHRYQMNNKLEQVAILLINKHFSNLKTIAINFGFYDEFHLGASFKRKFGVSPVRYSRSH